MLVTGCGIEKIATLLRKSQYIENKKISPKVHGFFPFKYFHSWWWENVVKNPHYPPHTVLDLRLRVDSF